MVPGFGLLQFGAVSSSSIIIMKNTFIINKTNSFRRDCIADTTVLRIFLKMKRVNNLDFIGFCSPKDD